MLINVEIQIYRVDRIHLTLIKDVLSAIEVPLRYKRKLFFFYLGENSNSNSTIQTKKHSNYRLFYLSFLLPDWLR